MGSFQITVPWPQDLREIRENVTERTRHSGFDVSIYLLELLKFIDYRIPRLPFEIVPCAFVLYSDNLSWNSSIKLTQFFPPSHSVCPISLFQGKVGVFCFFIRRKAAGTARPSSSLSTEADGVPSHWSSVPVGEEYSCERLSTITEEYKKTEKRFKDSMDESHKIVSIERVQNPDLWILFKQ